MKKLITALSLFLPVMANAGDRRIFWRIGEISNQVMFYLDDGAIFTNIPTSIFFFGITMSLVGLVLLPVVSILKNRKQLALLCISPLIATVGAFLFASLLGWIGTQYFQCYSVAVFWSWQSVGAILGGSVFLLTFLMLNRKKILPTIGWTLPGTTPVDEGNI